MEWTGFPFIILLIIIKKKKKKKKSTEVHKWGF